MASSTLDVSEVVAEPPRANIQITQTMSNGTNSVQTNTLLLVIIAILLPPLAVFLKTKDAMSTVINLVLTLLFYIPGLIHALYLILKK